VRDRTVKHGAVYFWIGQNQYSVSCYLEREKEKGKYSCSLKTRLAQIKIPVYTKNLSTAKDNKEKMRVGAAS
jgi:hypothetical protein